MCFGVGHFHFLFSKRKEAHSLASHGWQIRVKLPGLRLLNNEPGLTGLLDLSVRVNPQNPAFSEDSRVMQGDFPFIQNLKFKRS